MTTGTSDGTTVTVEVKENGHQHGSGDSENGASKTDESSNIQTKEVPGDKQEPADEIEIGKHYCLLFFFFVFLFTPGSMSVFTLAYILFSL